MRQPTAREAADYSRHRSRVIRPCFDHVAQLSIVDVSKPTPQELFVGSGTASLVRTQSRSFVVTCSHVYAEFKRARAESEAIILMLQGTGGVPSLDLSDAAILGDGAKKVDLVSLEAPSNLEIQRLNKRFFDSEWPPPRGREGQVALAFGLPTQMRRIVSEVIQPKRFCIGNRITSVSDRHCVIADVDESRVYFRGENSFPESSDVDLGGMSGGAVFTFDIAKEPKLCGFVYETTQGASAHLMVMHADFLRADGSIDEDHIVW